MKETITKKERVKRIFDSIAHKYDFLNHLLSLGIDFYWRKKAIQLTGLDNNSMLLDIACGTGDFSLAAIRSGVKNIFGADLSINMLHLINKKVPFIKGKTSQCAAEFLPFKDDSFTNVIAAFGVRNFYDIRAGFKQFHRVLKQNGRATILEFRLPENRTIKNLYLVYFNKVLPFIGKIISKDREAYKYLPESVNEFDEKIALVDLLKQSGFLKVEYYSITFGLVQIVIAHKT
ncbi:MAG: bifunctional demethylmenaquinone methyltransferase/2-methoxy-6-polyprenyl-1,4-benzoquinol methylase UbiE [Bacteroidota bacterium]